MYIYKVNQKTLNYENKRTKEPNLAIIFYFAEEPSLIWVLAVASHLAIAAYPVSLGLAFVIPLYLGLSRARSMKAVFHDALSLRNIGQLRVLILRMEGVLTSGQLRCGAIIPTSDSSVTAVLKFAASIEQESNHAFAKTLLDHANKNGLTLERPENVESFAGQGRAER